MSTASTGHKITGYTKASSASGAAGATIKGVVSSGSGFTRDEGSSLESKTLGLKNVCLKSRSPYVSSYRAYGLAKLGAMGWR